MLVKDTEIVISVDHKGGVSCNHHASYVAAAVSNWSVPIFFQVLSNTTRIYLITLIEAGEDAFTLYSDGVAYAYVYPDGSIEAIPN